MNTVDENRVVKKKQSGKIRKKGQIDWMITLLPLGLIAALSILFFLLPEQSNTVLAKVRFFLGDTFGVYYLAIGLGVFLLSLYLAFSKYGDIVLGEQDEKPKYSFFAWGSMMFTCGLAADILFYSFAEWVMYAADPQIEKMGGIQEWAGVYPLFHWSLIPWGFYLVLAAAFGFMLHVRKRNRQRYSEACRPIMGKQTDGIGGRLIDLLAVFALLAGTATTFSVATPLMASAINALFHINLDRNAVTIVILLITCFVFAASRLPRNRFSGKALHLSVFRATGVRAAVRRTDAVYYRDGIFIAGTDDSVFPDVGDRYRSAARDAFSAELDYLLLGILDGMVRGGAIFYRKYFPGKNGAADNPWRIWIRRWLHDFKLYHPGK